MSNYDEAIKIVDKIYNETDFTKEELQPLIDYLDKSETTEKELNELKRDVARYFELWGQAKEKWGNGLDDKEAIEYTKLHLKLSKAGKEER